MPAEKRPTRQDVAQRFGARAGDYEASALLQRAAAARLAELVAQAGGLPQGPCLEIGCGTGLLTRLLAPQCASYLATDLSQGMLERCQTRLGHLPGLRFGLLDGEDPQLDAPVAAIVSSLTAQWFADPLAGLARLATRAPYFAFGVPLSGSFPEWEQAFADLGRSSGLRSLPREEDLRRALAALPDRRAQFVAERIVLRYADGRAFAEGFRRTGADLPRPGYRPGPIRAVLKRFAGGMDATARVLYGIVRKEEA